MVREIVASVKKTLRNSIKSKYTWKRTGNIAIYSWVKDNRLYSKSMRIDAVEDLQSTRHFRRVVLSAVRPGRLRQRIETSWALPPILSTTGN